MANLFSEKPIVKVVMLKGQDGEEKLINQADGSGLSFWIGTQAEYDAIPESQLIANCVYYITDDTRDDFNTRLNELDTKVDNNTTAIANNTETIEPLIAELDFIARKGAIDPSEDVNVDKIKNPNDYTSFNFRAKKIGKTMSIYGSFTLKNTISAMGTLVSIEFIENLAKAIFGDTPTSEQYAQVNSVIDGGIYAPAFNPSVSTPYKTLGYAYAGTSVGFYNTEEIISGEIRFTIVYETQA